MSLDLGSLTHRLRVQKATTTKDSMGTPIRQWDDVATVWAKRTNTLSATAEAIASGVEVAQRQVRFDMHPMAINPAMRLIDAEGVIYDIRSLGLSNDRSALAVIATSNGERL